MSNSRLELKVGLFVVVLLGLAAVMVFKFSESGLGWGDTVALKLKTTDAGTVVNNSPVLMSGVKIGYVDAIDLEADGLVTITVQLNTRDAKHIDANSTFAIKSSGFLGDQYIGVFPPPMDDRAKAPLPTDVAQICEPPFDIMTVARDAQVTIGHAQGLIEDVSARVRDLNATIHTLNQNIFNPATMSDFRATITNFAAASTNLVLFTRDATNVAGRVQSLLSPATVAEVTNSIARFNAMMGDFTNVSHRVQAVLTPQTIAEVTNSIVRFNASMANFTNFTHELSSAAPMIRTNLANLDKITTEFRKTAGEVRLLVSTNRPAVTQALKNFEDFSKQLTETTEKLKETLSKNETNFTHVVGNIKLASEQLKGITSTGNQIVKDLESGKGLAGGLLRDEAMRLQFQQLVTNLNHTATNLDGFITNVNLRAAELQPILKAIRRHGLFHKPKDPPLKFPRGTRPK